MAAAMRIRYLAVSGEKKRLSPARWYLAEQMLQAVDAVFRFWYYIPYLKDPARHFITGYGYAGWLHTAAAKTRKLFYHSRLLQQGAEEGQLKKEIDRISNLLVSFPQKKTKEIDKEGD